MVLSGLLKVIWSLCFLPQIIVVRTSALYFILFIPQLFSFVQCDHSKREWFFQERQTMQEQFWFSVGIWLWFPSLSIRYLLLSPPRSHHLNAISRIHGCRYPPLQWPTTYTKCNLLDIWNDSTDCRLVLFTFRMYASIEIMGVWDVVGSERG